MRDLFLSLGERHQSFRFETAFGIAQIYAVQTVQIMERFLKRCPQRSDLQLEQRQEQSGQIADKDVRFHMIIEAVSNTR